MFFSTRLRWTRVNTAAETISDQNDYTDARAHELRARYVETFGGEEVPVAVCAIAEDLLGLHVEEVQLDGVSGLLYPPQRRILLNARDGEARRRFTLAHEVGHWVCQCADVDDAPEVLCRAEDVTLDPDARAIEREANVFAAELLMPEPAVRGAWGGDADACAERFGVSGEAMRWRLYSFGLESAPQRLPERGDREEDHALGTS